MRIPVLSSFIGIYKICELLIVSLSISPLFHLFLSPSKRGYDLQQPRNVIVPSRDASPATIRGSGCCGTPCVVRIEFTTPRIHPSTADNATASAKSCRYRLHRVTFHRKKRQYYTIYYIRRDPLTSTPRTKTIPSPRPAFSGACPRAAMHGGERRRGHVSSGEYAVPRVRVDSTTRRGDSRRRDARNARRNRSRRQISRWGVYCTSPLCVDGLPCSSAVSRSLLSREQLTRDGIQADALRGPVDATLRVSPRLAYVRCHI